MTCFSAKSLRAILALSLCFSGALGVSTSAQELFSYDFNDYDTAFPEQSYFYAYAYAGQGTPDCETNVDNGDQITNVASFGTATDQFAKTTGDFSNWTLDALGPCWTYAGIGSGAGYVLGGDDGNGGIGYQRKFTSNDFSQYSVTFDAWTSGIEHNDPNGTQLQLNIQLQGPGISPASGNPAPVASFGFNDTNSTSFVNDTPQTYTFTFDELEFFADVNGTPTLYPTYADYQAGDWDLVTQLQVQVQAQGSGELDFGFDADNAIHFDNVVVNAPFEELVQPLTCDFDSDTDCDPVDLDLLYGNFGTAGGIYDVDLSGTVDAGDIGEFLAQASDPANPFNADSKTFALGDLNFDGNVNSSDLGVLLNSFGDTAGLLYEAGNLNDDATVDSGDLGLMLNNFGFTSPVPASAVPEPGSSSLLLIAAFSAVAILRRR